MNAHQEAAAIIAHYLKQLTQASGRRWTEHNDRDMHKLAGLLSDDQAETITPYYQPEPPQLDTRVTTVLERVPASHYAVSADDLDDPAYQRWRQQRQQDEQTRRMLRREEQKGGS